MAHPFYPSGNPRFNHVALSVPADVLGEESRKDLCRFWGDVLGFEEMPTTTIDGKRMVLSCVHWDQFIFLIAEDEPLKCPPMDHFGFSVGTLDELVAARDRAAAFAAEDPRARLIDLNMDDQGTIKIHSIYVGFVLPMLCELQYWEFVK
ncbi:MAG TPA: hypothetical protein VKR22_15170 [Acidimicrobiales bacterium]|nr:hypothetical protein [Acidimicrobiales bacterium]